LRIPHTSARAGSKSFSATLPPCGLMQRGECSALQALARHTFESDFGSLPTPTTKGNELAPSMTKWPAHRRLHAMAEALARGPLPTPTARLYGYNKGGSAGRVGKNRPSLETILGRIRLPFREWMMGWPIGWSALEPLGTDRFREWLRWHGES
jgi:hypothetical protein